MELQALMPELPPEQLPERPNLERLHDKMLEGPFPLLYEDELKAVVIYALAVEAENERLGLSLAGKRGRIRALWMTLRERDDEIRLLGEVADTTRRDHLTRDGNPREGHLSPPCQACAAHLALLAETMTVLPAATKQDTG